jgi:1-acylglycerone phosphate reductase
MSDLVNLPKMTLLVLDVTSHDSIKAAVASVQEELGAGVGLDLLVNNAGVASSTPALDHKLDDIRGIFETNLFGMMSMVQVLMSLLILSSDAYIVNVGSIVAYIPLAFGSSYNANKAAIHSYSDTLRVGECYISSLHHHLTGIAEPRPALIMLEKRLFTRTAILCASVSVLFSSIACS